MKPKMSLLRFHRLTKGLTLLEVANETGIPSQTLSLIERGLRKPMKAELYKLSYLLGFDLSLIVRKKEMRREDGKTN